MRCDCLADRMKAEKETNVLLCKRQKCDLITLPTGLPCCTKNSAWELESDSAALRSSDKSQGQHLQLWSRIEKTFGIEC